MPRKTKTDLELMQEAMAKGDTEAVLALAQKISSVGQGGLSIVKDEKPKRTTKKSMPVKKTGPIGEHPHKKGGPTTKPGRKARTKPTPPAPNTDEDVGKAQDAAAGIFRPMNEPKMKDGKNFGVTASMAGEKHVNIFVDTGTKVKAGNVELDGKLTGKLAKAEKQLKKQTTTARPGCSGAARDVAKKVRTICVSCRNEFQVYQSEVGATVDENGRSKEYYKCTSCLRRRL